MQTHPPGPRIYNLFPLLVGPVTRWRPHLERARRLGFDWVFVNSFHQSGFSASLYSVKDHYAIDARLVDPAAGPPHGQLQQVIATARELGLKLMMDLIINHTAIDSPLVHEHPDWYKRDETGEPVHPGARDGERWVVWGDLAEIDNAASRDRDALWQFWLRLAETYAALGFYGFVLGGDRRHRWSIPDRKIAMKYLIAVKGGMDPRQWAQLHPEDWKRLVQIAPLRE